MKRLGALLALLLFSSCGEKNSYILATHQEKTTLAEIGGHFADLLLKRNGWTVEVLAGEEYNSLANLHLITEGRVDFAISSSDLPSDAAVEVRTVLPIYPEILVVLYNPSRAPATLRESSTLSELLDGRRVGVGPKDMIHSEVALSLIRDFGVDPSSFTPVYTPLDEMKVIGGEMDVMLTFAGADRKRIEDQIQSGAKLFSLGDVALDRKGSRVDGFLLRNPQFDSFIIPRNTFENYPEEPILTLAVMVVLVTRRDMGEDVVYELVATVLESSNHRARRNPLLGFLSSEFDATRLSFPLHEGTRQYLNRDQPGFLERYAEVMALVFSLVIVVAGVLGSANRLLKRTKKDRIDVYYQAIRKVEEKPLENEEEIRAGIRELRELKARAVRQLQEERLEANESFTIFLDLLHYAVRELENKLGRPR